jgi:nicotinate-nucleotide--dimethylbenzimidazole phosphoribosyltransferase
MGIGNTTTAAAVASAITGCDPAQTAGRGTGLNSEGVQRKVEVIRRALARHNPDPNDAVGVLAAVGGFEIGAIAGFLVRASELRLPVVIDGFPCTAGALIARTLEADALDTMFFSHLSPEPGHRIAIDHLGGRPWFELGMRLGEGTGAAMMLGLVDIAVRLYREMATFEEARVSDGSPSQASI